MLLNMTPKIPKFILTFTVGISLLCLTTPGALAKGYSARGGKSSHVSRSVAKTRVSKSTPRPYYGGGHHTESHGGTYVGGRAVTHAGGHYTNGRTANRYGIHKPGEKGATGLGQR